ncbi:MAG: exonuclease SbcCD subunit D C-terminal domain-containing protein [Desulfamplus sp.]|nr:exonuclease SbcCD subunit D C-terminal domain-containing protein [Desulfamplus sp.]
MKILHTSDWHLGRSLYGRKRYDEFTAFLDWLIDTIKINNIDALLVAGDVFDTTTPSNRSQELYYNFLYKVSLSCCRHVVVIGGNHDSPSFLDAPKELLKALNVYVIGEITEDKEDEVIVLCDKQNCPELIVCAVPYLRDKDIRNVELGESIEDKNIKLIQGLKNHYTEVCSIAEQKKIEFKQNLNLDIPIIAMGHLFTSGGKTIDGDGVRELYVGNLAHIGKELFPTIINYFALGHLHVPQSVGNTDHIRYSGSPLPMCYGEANQIKKVIVVEFNETKPLISEIEIPSFQRIEKIVGSLDEIYSRIEYLKNSSSSAWLEIEYTAPEFIGNIRELLHNAVDGSSIEILSIKNRRIIDRIIRRSNESETLDDLDVNDVFDRCLDTFDVPSEERIELINSYNEIIKSIHEKESNAE